MTTLERLRSAVGTYEQLCPIRCADLRAALDALDALKNLTSEMHHFDGRGRDLRRQGAFKRAVETLERLEE